MTANNLASLAKSAERMERAAERANELAEKSLGWQERAALALESLARYPEDLPAPMRRGRTIRSETPSDDGQDNRIPSRAGSYADTGAIVENQGENEADPAGSTEKVPSPMGSDDEAQMALEGQGVAAGDDDGEPGPSRRRVRVRLAGETED